VNAARSGRPEPEGAWPRLSTGRYDSFIIRVFSRSKQGEPLEGQVTHIASHRSVRFTDLQRAVAFIRDQLAQARAAPNSSEEAASR
jgi:hypothetical protein